MQTVRETTEEKSQEEKIFVSKHKDDKTKVFPKTDKPHISARSRIRPDQAIPSKFPYWCFRRTQDIIFSLLALVILSPLMLLIALAIWIDSPGASPLFIQERVGRRGKHFKIYKFRSMVPDAEGKLDVLMSKNERNGFAFKMKDDPRITKVGRFIRRFSLDELPQLVNVLKGDMSIVGPRPALPRETEQYTEYEWQRFYATPGLTCYWQIHPHKEELSFDEWVELDIRYMRERSFAVDWKIIFKTIGIVIHGSGE